jgi:hypothetical protein
MKRVSWFTAMIWSVHFQTEPRASASGFVGQDFILLAGF